MSIIQSKIPLACWESTFAENLTALQDDFHSLEKSLRVERSIRHDLERACAARGLGSLVHTMEDQVAAASPRAKSDATRVPLLKLGHSGRQAPTREQDATVRARAHALFVFLWQPGAQRCCLVRGRGLAASLVRSCDGLKN